MSRNCVELGSKDGLYPKVWSIYCGEIAHSPIHILPIWVMLKIMKQTNFMH